MNCLSSASPPRSTEAASRRKFPTGSSSEVRRRACATLAVLIHQAGLPACARFNSATAKLVHSMRGRRRRARRRARPRRGSLVVHTKGSGKSSSTATPERRGHSRRCPRLIMVPMGRKEVEIQSYHTCTRAARSAPLRTAARYWPPRRTKRSRSRGRSASAPPLSLPIPRPRGAVLLSAPSPTSPSAPLR